MASFKKAAPLYFTWRLMLTSATKRFSLPFSNQKTSASEVEVAAIFAFAEIDRNKGGGLIARQPEEKLVFLIKSWLPVVVISKKRQDVRF